MCHDCAGLSSPAVKKAIWCSSAKAPSTTRRRPDSPTPMSARMALASSSSSSESSASRREETATASAPICAACSATAGGTVVVALVDVGHQQHRLGRERVQVAQRVGRVGGHRHRARRAALLQRGDDLGHPALLGLGLLVAAARLLGHALQAALGLLEVGVEQLGLDGLDVAARIDLALGVDDVVVVMGAHDVDDGVDLADVGQELVAQALALAGAAHEAGDVVEVDGVVDDVRGADRLRHAVEALVDDRHDGDVRLDGRERVVGRLGARARQRVEERRLARVGHPDDPDLHRAALPMASPSSAPPATSVG